MVLSQLAPPGQDPCPGVQTWVQYFPGPLRGSSAQRPLAQSAAPLQVAPNVPEVGGVGVVGPGAVEGGGVLGSVTVKATEAWPCSRCRR